MCDPPCQDGRHKTNSSEHVFGTDKPEYLCERWTDSECVQVERQSCCSRYKAERSGFRLNDSTEALPQMRSLLSNNGSVELGTGAALGIGGALYLVFSDRELGAIESGALFSLGTILVCYGYHLRKAWNEKSKKAALRKPRVRPARSSEADQVSRRVDDLELRHRRFKRRFTAPVVGNRQKKCRPRRNTVRAALHSINRTAVLTGKRSNSWQCVERASLYSKTVKGFLRPRLKRLLFQKRNEGRAIPRYRSFLDANLTAAVWPLTVDPGSDLMQRYSGDGWCYRDCEGSAQCRRITPYFYCIGLTVRHLRCEQTKY